MGDISLEQVEVVCGKPKSNTGSNYYFRCPICTDEGHDKAGDNLVYNSDKQILKCFANYQHSVQVLNLINNTCPKTNYTPVAPKPTPVNVWEVRQNQYLDYLRMTQELLLDNIELLDEIFKKRKLSKRILDLCGVGYDNTEDCFTIPIISLKHDCIVDFELRYRGEEKKIRRIGGGCNTIAKIWGLSKAKTLIICEGFIDAITLAQYMFYETSQNDFTIYSCSNGVSSLLNVMPEINFKNFNEVKLIVDNDKAGDEATEAITTKYSFIKDCRQFLKDSNCKDINEWYIMKKKGK